MTDSDPCPFAEILEKNDVLLLRNALNDADGQCKKLDSASYKIPEKQSHLPLDSLTLLHIAAFYDSLESFIFLQEELESQGFSKEQIFSMRSAAEYYPLHYALINASCEVSKYIIERFPSQVGLVSNGDCISPLTLAVIGGMHELVDFLFENDHGTITKDQINKAFDMAISTRNYPCLQILIDKRAPQTSNNAIRETVSMKAAYALSPEAVSLVMENDRDELHKIFYSQNSGKTESDCLLHRLCTQKPPLYKKQILKALDLMQGHIIEPDAKYHVKGPCHWMCYFGDIDVAKKMFENFKINVNRVDENYKTGPYLMIRDKLSEKDTIEILNFLIERDFDVNLMTMEDGKLKQKTLLEEFCSYQVVKPEVIEYLLSKGANPDAPTFIQQGKYGTIREYVKKRKTALISIFNKYPKK